jgi:D-sedoheptulose 7-phosphate isomerase
VNKLSIAGDHFKELIKLIDLFDHDSFELVAQRLKLAVEQETSIFIGGNGGSATIALHYATDWTKGVLEKKGKCLRVFPLNANPGLTTAIANDIDFESSLSFQLQALGKKDDIVVLVSSSGNSTNIVNAAVMARKIGMPVIGISGFDESKLVQLSDFSLTINSTNMQLIEDLHGIIGHLIYLFLIES